MILKDDGYLPVTESEVVPGDVVIYKFDGEIAHVAVVIGRPVLQNSDSQIDVLSQWGKDGEYFHEHRDVPVLMGKPAEFYSERRKV